jgi:hypothetical protein
MDMDIMVSALASCTGRLPLQFLRFKFVYCTRRYLDGKRATLTSVSDDMGILVYEKAEGNQKHLPRWYLYFCVDDHNYMWKIDRGRIQT